MTDDRDDLLPFPLPFPSLPSRMGGGGNATRWNFSPRRIRESVVVGGSVVSIERWRGRGEEEEEQEEESRESIEFPSPVTRDRALARSLPSSPFFPPSPFFLLPRIRRSVARRSCVTEARNGNFPRVAPFPGKGNRTRIIFPSSWLKTVVAAWWQWWWWW